MKQDVYVIIHGFGGSVKETDYIAKYLMDKGLNVHQVALAGHGGTKKDLSKTNSGQWLHSVETAIINLKKEYRAITLVGFSMGGLLAMRFSSLPEVKKLVLINTPVFFWNFKVILKDVFSSFTDRDKDALKYYAGSVSRISVKSGIDFLILLLGSKKFMQQVNIPCLILQCKEDESVYYKSAYYLCKHIKGSVLKLYEGGRHQIFERVELRDDVCETVLKWLRE